MAFDNTVPEMPAIGTEPSLLLFRGTRSGPSVVDPQVALDYEEPFHPMGARVWQAKKKRKRISTRIHTWTQ
jgi:hypothetical protein